MKKFIIKCISFLLLISCVSLFLDHSISSGLKQSEEYRFQTWNDIVESKINADVLICGNSRAFSHYSPRILDSVLNVNSYNIGIGGYPFNVQYLRFKLYETCNKKPHVIIQNIDFMTLNNSVFGHEREQLFPFVGNNYLKTNLTNYGFSKLELYLPLYRYFGYPMVIKNGLVEYFGIKHYHMQPSYKGYRPEYGKWDDSELNKLTTIEAVMEGSTIQLFDEFLSYCKKNKITVILVNSPLYCEAKKKLVNRDSLDSLIKGFSQKYEIPFLDYTNDSMCFDTTYFHIAVHLNEKGAEFFSRKLAKDIKSMNIITPAKTNLPRVF